MQKNFFTAKRSLLSVSKKTESGVATIHGKRVELVDTPGLLDPSSVEQDKDRLEFARSLLTIKYGFHVLGLVLSSTRRIDAGEDKVLENLLSRYKHYLPYIVLFFTRAVSGLGDTKDEQKCEMEDMIEEIKEDKTSNLFQVLEKIQYRYIILESVTTMEQGYYASKSKELVEMIERIFKQTGKPATNDFALSMAKNLEKAKVDHNDQMALEIELAERIKVAQEMMKKDKSEDNFYPYLKYAILIGGGVLATLLPAPVGGIVVAVTAAHVIRERCTFQ